MFGSGREGGSVDGKNWELYCGNCRDVLATLPDNSIDLIATDPPYHRVKSLGWNRQQN